MTLWHILLKGKRKTANRNNETSNNIRIFRKPQTGTKSHLWLFLLNYFTKWAVLAVHLCKVILVHIQIGLLCYGDAAMT